MVIGERLKDLREQKKLSQATSKNARVCFAVTFHGLKMGTQFHPWKLWRSWLVRWKFRRTGFSPMMHM
jgi:transcriptional regulator with XRE-family HTH domain